MPFQAPTFDDCGHAKQINYGLSLAMPFRDWIKNLAVEIHRSVAGNRKPRKDLIAQTENALNVIVANLVRAHHCDPNRYVTVPLGNDAQPKAATLPIPLGGNALRRVVGYLLNAKPCYAEKRAGNNDPATGAGYWRRLRARKKLIDELESCFTDLTAPDSSQMQTMFDVGTLPVDPQSPRNLAFFNLHCMPVIHLKPANHDANHAPDDLPTPQNNDDIRRMEVNLRLYNSFLQDHWVDLLVPDADMQKLQRTGKRDDDTYFGDKGKVIEVDLLFRKSLYRVFNDGRYDHGGRFYGGWWQNIPSHYRQAITINGGTTAELDYSSLHPSMLYALEGKTPPKDCYALEGFPKEHRKLLKRAFNKLVNATGHIQPPKKETVPEGWAWTMIRDGLLELHAPIAHHFRTGMGITLQRIDSDIAEQVMLTMMDENVLALPVHDSFIVWDTKLDRLSEVMLDVYQSYLHSEIGVKADPIWIQEHLSAEAHEFHETGVRHIEDSICEYREGPEYARYRQRMTDWLELKGEGWGHRHSFSL